VWPISTTKIEKTPDSESPPEMDKIPETTDEQDEISDEKTIPTELTQPKPDEEFVRKCSFCSVKSDDLKECDYCNELFCKAHLEPKTSHNFLRSNGGHSCKQFADQEKKEQQPISQPIKISKPSKSIKKTLHNFSNRFISWFYCKKHPHSKLRKENFFIHLIIIIVLSLFFMIVYSNSDQLNTIVIGFIKLGAIIQICLIIPIIWSIYKILINLRYGLRGLANGFKFITAIVILIFCFQIYLQPSLITRPVTQFDYGTFNPLEINWNSQSNGATTNNNNSDGNQGIVIPSINPKPVININELETEIHNLINNERQKSGVAALKYDTKLANIARAHSQDMAARNYFSHYTPEGDGPTERAIKAGYSVHKELGGGYYSEGIAENIFQNNLYDTVTYYNGIPVYDWNSQSEIASSTVNGWMNSPGHRQNILNSDYDNEGIGVAISSDDKVYITEDFW